MTEPPLIGHDSRAAMAETLASEIAADLRAAVARRGCAGVIVSGGSTPKALFERLARKDLAWSDVTVTLADERWGPPDHAASNARLVRESLLCERARKAAFLPLVRGAKTPAADADAAEAGLDAFPWPADITILGMGTDGHTASWFPDASELAVVLDPAGKRRCLPLVPDPLPAEAPYPRLTLTLPAVLASRRILVLLAGADKRDALETATAGDETMAMPIRAVLHQQGTPVALHWAP